MTDLICSEVHTFTHQLGEDGETGTRLARFMFSTPPSLGREWTSLSFGAAELEFTGIRRSRSIPVDVGEDSGGEDIEVPRFTSLDCRGLGHGMVEYDSDGDMDLPRKGAGRDKQLVMEHRLATELGEVGLQVWRGSLVLADYLLEHHLEVLEIDIIKHYFHDTYTTSVLWEECVGSRFWNSFSFNCCFCLWVQVDLQIQMFIKYLNFLILVSWLQILRTKISWG